MKWWSSWFMIIKKFLLCPSVLVIGIIGNSYCLTHPMPVGQLGFITNHDYLKNEKQQNRHNSVNLPRILLDQKRVSLFSDKNWLELIWASYGDFVVFHLLKKTKIHEKFWPNPWAKIKNIFSRCHYDLQLSELVVMHPWTFVKPLSNVS